MVFASFVLSQLSGTAVNAAGIRLEMLHAGDIGALFSLQAPRLTRLTPPMSDPSRATTGILRLRTYRMGQSDRCSDGSTTVSSGASQIKVTRAIGSRGIFSYPSPFSVPILSSQSLA